MLAALTLAAAVLAAPVPKDAKPAGPAPRDRALSFLAAFLDDGIVREFDPDDKRSSDVSAAKLFRRIEVRDFAAMELGRLLGLEAEPQPDWTDGDWAKYRATVREALEREQKKS